MLDFYDYQIGVGKEWRLLNDFSFYAQIAYHHIDDSMVETTSKAIDTLFDEETPRMKDPVWKENTHYLATMRDYLGGEFGFGYDHKFKYVNLGVNVSYRLASAELYTRYWNDDYLKIGSFWEMKKTVDLSGPSVGVHISF